MKKDLKIKEWFYEKIDDISKTYQCFIDFKRDENGMRLVDDGCVTVYAEVLAESDKAIKATLETGSVVGSRKGWTTWIPKAVIEG